MHRIHSADPRQIPRSKLGATLLRLHRSVENSHQQERAAQKTFAEWQLRWSAHRDEVAQRLARLDRAICELARSFESTPQLLILNSESPEITSEEEPISVRIGFPARSITGNSARS
jgi:ABC-type branched-subunit amino acid transport system ATPase component